MHAKVHFHLDSLGISLARGYTATAVADNRQHRRRLQRPPPSPLLWEMGTHSDRRSSIIVVQMLPSSSL